MDFNKRKRAHGKLIALVCMAVLVLMVALLSFSRSLGFWGLVMRLGFGVLYIVAGIVCLITVVFKRDKSGGKVARFSAGNIGAAVGALVLMAAYLFAVALPCVFDMMEGAVTQRVMLESLTVKQLRMQRLDNGGEVSLRIGVLEKYTFLNEVRLAETEAKANYGTPVERAQGRGGEEKPVYFTITYYPRSMVKVAVEDIQVGN